MTDVTTLEKQLLSLLRGKFSSLHLTFNEHATSHVDARENMLSDDFKHVHWVSAEEKAKAIETNSVWILHWYPDTPGGFHAVGASSLGSVLSYVMASEAK